MGTDHPNQRRVREIMARVKPREWLLQKPYACRLWLVPRWIIASYALSHAATLKAWEGISLSGEGIRRAFGKSVDWLLTGEERK
jgi:hypothetical protein